MAFGDFKTLGEAQAALQVSAHWEEFLHPVPVPVSDPFRARIRFRLDNCPLTSTEASVGETLIYPVLEECLLPYAQDMVIWSHPSVYEQGRLLGVVDYVLARRSPLGAEVKETPYAAAAEAKRGDIEVAWAQCLPAMHALRRLDGHPELPIYGIVSSGFVWCFGRLHGQTFVRHPQNYDLHRLDELCAVLNGFYLMCKQEVLAPAAAA